METAVPSGGSSQPPEGVSAAYNISILELQ